MFENARAGERAKALGAKRVIPLPVSAPFHCALMKPAQERLAPELWALPSKDPSVPIVANIDAEPRRDAAGAIEALVEQVSSPVRWEEVVRRLASEGVTTYVEVGTGTVLGGLVKKIHKDARMFNMGGPADLAALDDRLDLKGRRVLFTAARLVRRKGHAQVLEILARLGSRYPLTSSPC